MARGDFLPGVILPTNGLNDAVLSACHPLAPVISIVVRTLSAACVEGWIPANHLTPGVVLHATGTLAGLLRLTPAKVGEVLDAMDATGLLATGSDGTRRMADHDVIIGAVSDSNVRYARRVSRGKTRAKENNKLDGVCLTKRDQCLPHEKTAKDNGSTPEDMAPPAACHDAPVDTSTSLDLYLQRSPSGSGPKKEEGGGTRSQTEGQCLSLPGMASPSPAGPLVVTRRDAQAIVALARMDREDKDAPLPVRLTTFFLARLLDVKPDRKVPSEPVIIRWVNDMRLLLKDRGEDREADIRAVIEWAMTDARFWQAALQSPGKLRSAFDELETKTLAARRRSEPPPVTYLNLAPSPSVQEAMNAVKGMKPSDVMRMFPGRTALDVHDEAKREYPDLFIEDAIRALKARYDGQREVSHA